MSASQESFAKQCDAAFARWAEANNITVTLTELGRMRAAFETGFRAGYVYGGGAVFPDKKYGTRTT